MQKIREVFLMLIMMSPISCTATYLWETDEIMPLDWPPSVAFFVSLFSYLILTYALRHGWMKEFKHLGQWQIIIRYVIPLFLFLTFKYPLFVLTGIIQDKYIIFYFRMADLLILSLLCISILPIYILFTVIFSKEPLWKSGIKNTENEAIHLGEDLILFVIGFQFLFLFLNNLKLLK